MTNYKNWIWLALFGSLWGIAEVSGGEFLYSNDIPHASIWLSAWALFLLATARGLINKPGSSTAVGGVATLFKLANASPFFCHLLGIFILGLAFDAAATVLLKEEKRGALRRALTGIISAYGGYTLFAFLITYVVRYEPWTAGGISKVLNHILVGGSFAALAGAVLVPFGYRAGLGADKAASRQPRWAAASAFVLIILIWTAGRFLK